jgi:hypothetical protein
VADEEQSHHVRDARGRLIVLSAERWRHICDGHPELGEYRSDLLKAIGHAVQVIPGRKSGEEWFYVEHTSGQAVG